MNLTFKSQPKILVYGTGSTLLRIGLDIKEKISGDTDFISDINTVISRVHHDMPHIVVADLTQALESDYAIFRRMKEDSLLGQVPLIALVNSTNGFNSATCPADVFVRYLPGNHDLIFQMRQILNHSHDELDLNPVTRLPGHRSTVEHMESMLRVGGPLAFCAVQIKHIPVFEKLHGRPRAESLLLRTVTVIRKILKKYYGGNIFMGHLSEHDYLLSLPVENSAAFAADLVESFEFHCLGFKSVKGHEPGVCLSVALVTNEHCGIHGTAEIISRAEDIHRRLSGIKKSEFLKESKFGTFLSPSNGYLWREVKEILTGMKTEVYFQPIIDIANGSIYAYEALSRFHKPGGGFIDPGSLFLAARECDLIKELDVLCLRSIMKASVHVPPPAKIFINLNRETVLEAENLKDIWKQCPIDRGRLVVEITEQSLLKEITHLIRASDLLKSNGMWIALDDAGGGAVSFREASVLRPNVMKFDRSLINGIAESALKQKLLTSLVKFAREIKALTVAEGIEMPSDLDVIKNMKIDLAQGYFLAKPAKNPQLRILVKY